MAQTITDLPLILINTHADPDHISGNGGFDEVYMSPKEEGNYRENGGTGSFHPIHEGEVIDEKNRILISGDSVQDGDIFMFGPMRNLERYIESLKHLEKFTDMFDEIYAMHGSFPVKCDLIEKVIEGAQLIKVGKTWLC